MTINPGDGPAPSLVPVPRMSAVPAVEQATASGDSPWHDPFLNSDDAGDYLGVPKATLLTWRVRRPGYGPHAVKAGGRLKYRLSELERWLREHEESFTEEEAATSPRADVVRTRHRASLVHGGVLGTAASPEGAA